jgi:integrase
MLETKSAPFTFVKQGIFYFSRRVPSDLSHHYCASRIMYSLRTKSASVAASRAQRAAQQLDEHWYHLRIREADLPGKHLLRTSGQAPTSAVSTKGEALEASVTLSEAVSIYLRLKGKDRPKTFHRAAERCCGYVIDTCGDKDLTAYTRADANFFRDTLLQKGLAGTSITRTFGTVRTIFNFAAAEVGITVSNPFTGVYYDRRAGVADRQPMPLASIRALQTICMEYDDDLRWLVALVSDTGMRLAEAAGLLLDDIKPDGPSPHVVIQEHPWRRLKTSGSARVVPLEGASLWAAQRLVSEFRGSRFAFPRYNRGEATNSNSASAALNKWMKQHVPAGCTMHSFRHSMRDRLRAVECPSDIVDQIGGWQTEGVGQSYGRGYPLEVLAKWVRAAV